MSVVPVRRPVGVYPKAIHRVSAQERCDLEQPQAAAEHPLAERRLELGVDDAAAPGERVLVELAWDSAELVLSLHDIELQLAKALTGRLDNPRSAIEVARVLREVVAIGGLASRRSIEALGAADVMRARRLMLEEGVRRDEV